MRDILARSEDESLAMRRAAGRSAEYTVIEYGLPRPDICKRCAMELRAGGGSHTGTAVS